MTGKIQRLENWGTVGVSVVGYPESFFGAKERKVEKQTLET